METNQEHGIKLYLKQCSYTSAIHNSMTMSLFFIGYRMVPHHLLKLAKLPIGKKFSSAVSTMVEQKIDVQKEVRARLDKSNVRYTTTVDKRRREKVFEKGDMMMVYLKKRKNSC